MTTHLPPFANQVLAKLRRCQECFSDFESKGVDIGRDWLDLLTKLGLLARVQRSPAMWEITDQGEQVLALPPAKPPTFDVLGFKYQHSKTKEYCTVFLTKAAVAEDMVDELHGLLTERHCQCETVGETNVLDCNCSEYTDDFELVQDPVTPAELLQAGPLPIEVELPLIRMARESDQIEIDGLKAVNDFLRAKLAERNDLLQWLLDTTPRTRQQGDAIRAALAAPFDHSVEANKMVATAQEQQA